MKYNCSENNGLFKTVANCSIFKTNKSIIIKEWEE